MRRSCKRPSGWSSGAWGSCAWSSCSSWWGSRRTAGGRASPSLSLRRINSDRSSSAAGTVKKLEGESLQTNPRWLEAGDRVSTHEGRVLTFMREMLRVSQQLLSRDSHSERDLLSRAIPLICPESKQPKENESATTKLNAQY